MKWAAAALAALLLCAGCATIQSSIYLRRAIAASNDELVAYAVQETDSSISLYAYNRGDEPIEFWDYWAYAEGSSNTVSMYLSSRLTASVPPTEYTPPPPLRPGEARLIKSFAGPSDTDPVSIGLSTGAYRLKYFSFGDGAVYHRSTIINFPRTETSE